MPNKEASTTDTNGTAFGSSLGASGADAFTHLDPVTMSESLRLDNGRRGPFGV